MAQPLWKNGLTIPEKFKHRIAIWYNNYTPKYAQKSKNVFLDKNLYMKVCNLNVHQWTNVLRPVFYPHNGILFSFKKEWNSNTYTIWLSFEDIMLIEISHRTKIIWFHLYKILNNNQVHIDRKLNSGYQRPKEKEEWKLLFSGYRISAWDLGG